jgi:hypothetical protein
MRIFLVALAFMIAGFLAGTYYEKGRSQQRYTMSMSSNGVARLDTWTGRIAVWADSKRGYLPEPESAEQGAAANP